MRTIVTNRDCPSDFRYEYDEEVSDAVEQFVRNTQEANDDDTLQVKCSMEGCKRAFELYYRELFGTRDARNRVFGSCLKEKSS